MVCVCVRVCVCVCVCVCVRACVRACMGTTLFFVLRAWEPPCFLCVRLLSLHQMYRLSHVIGFMMCVHVYIYMYILYIQYGTVKS